MRTRKICRGVHHVGPRWLLHTEFHVKVWGDEEGTWPAQLQSECKACQRMRARVNRARDRGRAEPYGMRKGRLSREERLARKRARYRKMMEDPVAGERRRKQQREYQRERGAVLRRKAGVPARGGWKKYRREERVVLDAGGLLEWIDTGGIQLAGGMGERERDLIRKARKSGKITLEAADIVVGSLGRPDVLAVLYSGVGVGVGVGEGVGEGEERAA